MGILCKVKNAAVWKSKEWVVKMNSVHVFVFTKKTRNIVT